MSMIDGRISDLKSFYSLITSLAGKLGGARTLAASSGRFNWPRRGVYFFMEEGEERSDSGSGPRIVRVGTHALTESSATKLWTRLSQHRGNLGIGGGNHRGSIFRLLVGTALIAVTATNSRLGAFAKAPPLRSERASDTSKVR